ncbi:MAG: hypothetical protein K2W95_20935 [Candidatus Obscuribacterales bacterium]|nr:hypothetical protein [Candidatus Obscuribacterales bacterium]
MQHNAPIAEQPLYVDDRYLSQRTPYSRSFWQHKRTAGGGPNFHRRGRRVYYLWNDVVSWLSAQSYSSTSEY